jgi:hypothetical protein
MTNSFDFMEALGPVHVGENTDQDQMETVRKFVDRVVERILFLFIQITVRGSIALPAMSGAGFGSQTDHPDYWSSSAIAFTRHQLIRISYILALARSVRDTLRDRATRTS